MIAPFRTAAALLLDRYRLARAAGATFGGKREVWNVLGYPEVGALTTQDFLDRYERGGVAGRVVDVLPAGTWRGEMWLQEDDDPEKDTDFELAWTELEKRLAIRQRFHQTDVLSRLSTYSVLLIGTADGELDKELPKGKPEDLLYLQPFLGAGGPSRGNRRGTTNSAGEADVTIQEYDLNTKSVRFARPLFYTLRRADVAPEVFQKPIHWSRVIHVAEGTLRDDVFGRPALERSWNYYEDLDKVVGGGSEAFWMRANAGLHLNVDKDTQLSTQAAADGKTELQRLGEQAELYQHQLTRMLRTRGVEVNQLGSDVANFQSPADVIITLIAGSEGIPKRLLVGSERGELASTQDRENFRDLINGRQANFAAPKIVRAFADRLIEYGYLPKPKEYKVMWPTIEVMSETEKAAGASSWASVNSSMGKTVFTEDEVRDKWHGMKPLTEDQKKAIEDEAAKKFEEQKALIQAKPAGKEEDKEEKPKPKPVARAAEEAGDDELFRILEQAIEIGADDVVAAIVGLGGPGSGRYPKGSGDQGGGSVTDAQMKSVADRLKSDIEYEAKGLDRYMTPQTDPVQKTDRGYEFGIRDFGAWQVPADARAESEDDSEFEDYDWNEPTPKTVDRLVKLTERHQKQNPDVHISWHAGEKNWIYFNIENKKLKTLKGTSSSGNHGHRGRPGQVGGSASAGFVRGSKNQAKALGLPPAWTDVMINPDPKGDLLATGKDAAGRTQYRYSAAHTEQASAEKHGRVAAFGKTLPALRKQIDKDYNDSDEAVVLDLIDKTSFRVGSDRDTKAKVQAYGASTLLDEHVKVKGDTIEFEFVAKKGTTVHKTITDGRLAGALQTRKAKSDGGALFNTSDKKIRDYMGKTTSDFTPKDFRTWNATREALSLVKKMPVPTSKAAFQKARNAVGEQVGAILGHTEKGGGKIALKSYISPSVFAKWEAKS